MNFASPRLAASGQSLLRATLVNSGADQATAAPTELGELPSWRLTDLYLSPSSEEFRSGPREGGSRRDRLRSEVEGQAEGGCRPNR